MQTGPAAGSNRAARRAHELQLMTDWEDGRSDNASTFFLFFPRSGGKEKPSSSSPVSFPPPGLQLGERGVGNEAFTGKLNLPIYWQWTAGVRGGMGLITFALS